MKYAEVMFIEYRLSWGRDGLDGMGEECKREVSGSSPLTYIKKKKRIPAEFLEM